MATMSAASTTARRLRPRLRPRREQIPQPACRWTTARGQLLGLRFSVIDVPGHGRAHRFFPRDDGAPILFCGTLFSGSCGRLFEHGRADAPLAVAPVRCRATRGCAAPQYRWPT
jgi:glyoxylase-like metal-dependent hydrolase (beta-lactamase superfamily II)